MAKRKVVTEEESKEVERRESSEEESSSDDVEFEWFDPQPEHDFHGLKTLLRQLFDVDAQSFDLSALTDLILAQPLLGSTVKVDGNETDPYAFLTVLNLHAHKSHKAQIGLILTERLINIPSEVVPPMYTMLLQEISWALEEKEPYEFTHYLIFSKTYREVTSTLDHEDHRTQKKQKKGGKKASSETFYFHPEDEVLQRHALAHGSFEYLKETGGPDAKRTFQELGIKPEGHLILIEAEKFEAAVTGLREYFNQH
ncbi:protein BCP1, partial [Lecanoromycetidae sp. Uapishka_2]